MTPPETQYAKSGDVSIAYQVVGSAELDLVFVPGFVCVPLICDFAGSTCGGPHSGIANVRREDPVCRGDRNEWLGRALGVPRGPPDGRYRLSARLCRSPWGSEARPCRCPEGVRTIRRSSH
jgi:hypothetical protein